VSKAHRAQPPCSFCTVDPSVVIAATELVFAIRDANPVTPLHTLVLPRRHVATYFDLSHLEAIAVDVLLRRIRDDIVAEDETVEGFNVGINIGTVAGQTILHCHVHLIPRRRGDVSDPWGGVRAIIPGKARYPDSNAPTPLCRPGSSLADRLQCRGENFMRDKTSKPDQPSLEEMLGDPIIWMVMKSDRVEEHEIRNLLERVAANLAAGGTGMSDTESIDSSNEYRRGVGIMLLNDQNQVLVGRRADAQDEAWQMPQGGIDDNEEPRDAAYRELREEIGTDKAQIIAESKSWLRYDLPPSFRKRWDDRWRGQQQKWFVMRFQGVDSDINIASEQPEFSAWKWVSIEQLPDLIISFKHQLYADLLHEFRESGAVADVAGAEKAGNANTESEGQTE
jgi:putative (di)nucleoside polyphosphate hydrolase